MADRIRMGLLKRVWHDPVWSKFIAAAIGWGASQVVQHWPPNLLASADHWVEAPVTVTRANLVIWPLQAASTAVAVYAAVLALRSKLEKRRAAASLRPQVGTPRLATPKLTLEELSQGPAVTTAGAAQSADVRAACNDLRAYHDRLRKLDGRFAERDWFVKSMLGASVKWTGVVDNARSHAGYVSLTIAATEQSENSWSDKASIQFPLDFRERVLTLTRGDRVSITGTVDKLGTTTWPDVRGESLEVLL